MRFVALFSLAVKSACNRKGTLGLIVLSVALSTVLLLGIDRIRTQLRESFVQSISGTDLIVGARGSDIQLLLYSVFHLGGATNNMGWDSAQKIAAMLDVAWSIPVSLGDSHQGFPVVATTGDFFKLYKYRRSMDVSFVEGKPFDDIFQVVLGSEVAAKLHYTLGAKITLTHGINATAFTEHADKPFIITGVLAPTGTPLDRALYINLASMEAIHIDWQGGAPMKGLHIGAEQVRKFNLEPKAITAMLVGLKKRSRVFAVQRMIGSDRDEPLMAVMPGVALDKLWQMVNIGEKALLLVSCLVVVTGLAGLAASILAGLGERRRELAILRSVGASPFDVLLLLFFEGMAIMLFGLTVGLIVLNVGVFFMHPILQAQFGVGIDVQFMNAQEFFFLGCIFFAGLFTSLIPAFKAYRTSLTDGMNVSV